MTKIGGDEEWEDLMRYMDGPSVPRGLGPEHTVPKRMTWGESIDSLRTVTQQNQAAFDAAMTDGAPHSLYTEGVCEVCGRPLCEGTHAGKPKHESDVDPLDDPPIPTFLRGPLPDLQVVTPERLRIGFGFGKPRDGALDAQLRTLSKLRRMNAEASAWPRNLIVAPARLGLGLTLLASARLLTKAFADGVRDALRRGGWL